MAPVAPRIPLDHLHPLSGIASTSFVTAAERLAVALSRERFAVIRLPQHMADVLKVGLEELLAGETRSFPGCDVREWHAGGEMESPNIELAYGIMEMVARHVLSALCRSNMLRLRSDTFSRLLEDLPLTRSAQGSSCLDATIFVDNFSHLSAAEAPAECTKLFVDPQQELVEPGLVGVLYAVEARGRGDSVLSAWQVKDSGGRWCSVALAADEVAVTLGHLMQHACAGLVQPGCHRVVGDPYSSGSLGADSRAGSTVGSRTRQGALPSQPKHGRRQLHFGLRPRPAAVLDLRRELEAAGHTVSASFPPMSVGHLLEEFESLLSPVRLAACTPDQRQGAAAHTAWEELQATLKRSRKRAGAVEQAPSGDRLLTRGAAVRLSTGGGATQRTGSRKKAQAGAAVDDKENGGMEWDAAGPVTRRRSSGQGRSSSAGGAASSQGMPSTGGQVQRRDSLKGGSGGSALYIVRGRRCTVLDDCLQQDPVDCLSICVRSFTGLERWFYCSASTRCGAIFEMYCARLGIALGAVKFMLRGERVFGASTPATLGLLDGEELTAVPDGSSDWLQQARELGPLYSAVFGKQAGAPAVDSNMVVV